MNKRLIWVLSAVLLGGVSVTAIASNHGMERHEEHRNHGQRDDSKSAEKHLAKLETALKLEASQRPAWNTFTKDLKALMQTREKQKEDMRATMQKAKQANAMTATERMDAMGQMMQVQQAHLAQMKQTTQTFVAQLTPEQQKVFNAQTTRLLGGGQGHEKNHEREGDKGQRHGCKD